VVPETSLVTTLSLPDRFDGQITRLVVTLASDLPMTGMPAVILATIENTDKVKSYVGGFIKSFEHRTRLSKHERDTIEAI
jgi:hypothetical protein